MPEGSGRGLVPGPGSSEPTQTLDAANLARMLYLIVESSTDFPPLAGVKFVFNGRTGLVFLPDKSLFKTIALRLSMPPTPAQAGTVHSVSSKILVDGKLRRVSTRCILVQPSVPSAFTDHVTYSHEVKVFCDHLPEALLETRSVQTEIAASLALVDLQRLGRKLARVERTLRPRAPPAPAAPKRARDSSDSEEELPLSARPPPAPPVHATIPWTRPGTPLAFLRERGEGQVAPFAVPWSINAEQRVRGLASLVATMDSSWKDTVSVAQRAEYTCAENAVSHTRESERTGYYTKHVVEVVNAIRASRYSVHLSVATNQALLMRAVARPTESTHPHFSIREWATVDRRSRSIRQIATELMQAFSTSVGRNHLSARAWSEALKLAFRLEWWAYGSNGKDMRDVRMDNLTLMFTPKPLNYSKTSMLPIPLRAEVASFLRVHVDGPAASAAPPPAPAAPAASAPDEDDVECTGAKTWAERDRELRAKAVVLD